MFYLLVNHLVVTSTSACSVGRIIDYLFFSLPSILFPCPQLPADHAHTHTSAQAPAVRLGAPTSRHTTEEEGVFSLLWFQGVGLCLTEAGEKNWAGFLLNSLGLLH